MALRPVRRRCAPLRAWCLRQESALRVRAKRRR